MVAGEDTSNNKAERTVPKRDEPLYEALEILARIIVDASEEANKPAKRLTEERGTTRGNVS